MNRKRFTDLITDFDRIILSSRALWPSASIYTVNSIWNIQSHSYTYIKCRDIVNGLNGWILERFRADMIHVIQALDNKVFRNWVTVVEADSINMKCLLFELCAMLLYFTKNALASRARMKAITLVDKRLIWHAVKWKCMWKTCETCSMWEKAFWTINECKENSLDWMQIARIWEEISVECSSIRLCNGCSLSRIGNFQL